MKNKKCPKCRKMMEHFKKMGWVFGEQGDIYICEFCGDTYTGKFREAKKK